MEAAGSLITIQNTTGAHWLITWPEAIAPGAGLKETVSFTVAVPRAPSLPMEDLQRYALKRAQELLQAAIRGTSR